MLIPQQRQAFFVGCHFLTPLVFDILFKMKIEDKRYSGTALPQRFYRNEFLVECPKCSREALVKVDHPIYLNNGHLTCYNCHYSLTEKAIVRYKAVVKRTCDNCGKEIKKITCNNKSKVESLTIPCNHCGTVRTYQPRNEEYLAVKENSFPSDPIFNNTLWFQCTIKDDLFWAYNKKHLLEIRKYVSSKLRERETLDYTTMVEKLPNFIKQAKNREIIIKSIDKLLMK